jgi:hypothetical protein
MPPAGIPEGQRPPRESAPGDRVRQAADRLIRADHCVSYPITSSPMTSSLSRSKRAKARQSIEAILVSVTARNVPHQPAIRSPRCRCHSARLQKSERRRARLPLAEDRRSRAASGVPLARAAGASAASDRETMAAGFAAPASCAIGTAAVVNDSASAFGAERITVIAGPADLAENHSASSSDMRATDANESVFARLERRKC